MKLFYPSKLYEIKKHIVKDHEKSKAIPAIKKDDDLKKFIVYLVGLEAKAVKAYSLTMEDIDLLRIATYIPHNYYGVPLENLLLAFQYRSSKECCVALYKEWQNSYNSKNCNDFIIKLLQSDDHMIGVIRENNYQKDEYQTILRKANKPTAFGRLCLEHSFPASYTFVKKAEFFGIESDSKLFLDMEALFYTYCYKKDYLEASNRLLEIVKKYNDETIKLFLVNYLSLLSISDLDKFESLGRYLNGRFGNVDSKKCIDYFAGFRKELWEKYRNWMIRLFVNDIFGLDERSVFWRDYSFVSKPIHYKKTDCVVMEFERYYSIEFLGKGMGPWYLFEKELYQTRIHKYVLTENNSSDLKGRLFDLYKSHQYVEPRLLRRVHNPNPGWQSNFRYEIKKWKVAVKLDLG